MKSGGHVCILLIVLWFGIITGSWAQDRDSTAFRLWYDFYFMHTLNSDFRYVVQTNFKHEINTDWKQLMVRTAFVYTMRDELYLQAGLSILINNEDDINIYEIRPWQGMNVFFPRIGQIFLNNFVRLEERFFLFGDLEDHSTSIRARYALSTHIPLNHTQIIEKTLYVRPYLEMFIPMYDRGFNPDFNHFRISLGLGYRFNKHIRSELSFLHERSKAEEEYHSFSDKTNTLRFTVRYLLNNGQKVRVL